MADVHDLRLTHFTFRTMCLAPEAYFRRLLDDIRTIELTDQHRGTRLIQDFLGHASIANTVRFKRLTPGRLAAVRVR